MNDWISRPDIASALDGILLSDKDAIIGILRGCGIEPVSITTVGGDALGGAEIQAKAGEKDVCVDLRCYCGVWTVRVDVHGDKS